MAEKAEAVTTTEWDTWRSFRSMHRQIDLALERQLQRDADISAADYGVLVALLNASGKQLRARELGEELAWEKSRISHQVSRMEKRGLVERRECETDARGTWIGITPDGSRAVLGATREHATSLRKYFFDILSDDELVAIRMMSERVLDVLKPDNCTEEPPEN